MTKIMFGNQHGKSRADYKIVTDGKSNSEITVGDQFDDSQRNAAVFDFGGLTGADLAALARELTQLHTALQARPEGREGKLAASQVAAAEDAARQGDSGKARQHLAQAGKWALDVATKIGIPLATAALKSALGLGG